MFTQATEPQSIGGVLDTGFNLFTAAIKPVFAITYVGALVGAIFGWFIQKAMLDGVTGIGTFDLDIPVIVGMYAAMMIVGSVLMAAAIVKVREVSTGANTSFGFAMVSGVKRAPAVFGVSIIYLLAFFAGSILLLIPGIYLSVMLAFAFYAAAADNMGPIESIKDSYALVKGSWWRTAGLLTVIFIIAIVFYVGLGFVIGIIAVSQDVAAALEPNLLTDIVILPIFTSVATAMLYCLSFAVYQDLKLRSGGSDLADRIENLD